VAAVRVRQKLNVASSAPGGKSPAAGALFTARFWLACAMHFCGAMGSSLYILFPLFIRHLGGSEFTIGCYAGITGAAAVAARLPVGRFLDTQGRRRVLVTSGCLHVASWLGFLSVGSLGVRSAALVVAYGLASGSLFAAYFTYASDITPVTRRSEGFAMFGIWGMLPNGLGPLLGEFLITRYGFTTYFLVAAAFAFLSLCFSSQLPETAGPATAASPHRRDMDASFPPRGFLSLLGTTLLFGSAVNSLFTFLAPFTYAHDGGGVGKFFMTYALTAVAVRVFSGRLPDRIGLRRVLVPAFFVYASGVLCIPHVGAGWALMLVGALCGAGHGYAFPILNALSVELASESHRGRAVSWLTAMFDLGNTVANPVLGAVANWAGFATMFTTSGLGMFIATLLSWRQQRPSRGMHR
jgi:MFS family permease